MKFEMGDNVCVIQDLEEYGLKKGQLVGIDRFLNKKHCNGLEVCTISFYKDSTWQNVKVESKYLEKHMEFELLGKTFTSVEKSWNDGDQIVFTRDDGRVFRFYNKESICFVNVTIRDVCGDLDDLVGSPLLQAEESSNQKDTDGGSQTWTFYRFATMKGLVVISWFGSSNGYYSERASFEEVE